MKHVLTIAGSDSGGGAGVQADLKTMCALGVYGMSAITAVTAQNTRRVAAVKELPPSVVAAQIDAVCEDFPVHAVKIGMVPNAEIIRAVVDRLRAHGVRNIVVDPVMVSKSGCPLLRKEAEGALWELIAMADLVTPNIPEAELLSGKTIRGVDDMPEAAEAMLGLGARHVLLKGGHLKRGGAHDLLWSAQGAFWMRAERIGTPNTHGTGCTLSSAVACGLAMGKPMPQAVREAKDYVSQAIRDALGVGGGAGPLGHMVGLYRAAGRSEGAEG